uniref:Si:dkey-7f3.14 n=1 Tax=Cyprinus carpio TaxID=7962 RepID=A0A8C2JM76_CYPCA
QQLTDIRTSQMGQEIKLTENVDMASQYTTNLKEQMDPLAKDLMTKITKGVDMLRERIEKLVSTVRCALKPYTEYVTSPFEKDVDYIRESLDFEDLKATVLQKSEELRDSLEQGVKELQAGLKMCCIFKLLNPINYIETHTRFLITVTIPGASFITNAYAQNLPCKRCTPLPTQIQGFIKKKKN